MKRGVKFLFIGLITVPLQNCSVEQKNDFPYSYLTIQSRTQVIQRPLSLINLKTSITANEQDDAYANIDQHVLNLINDKKEDVAKAIMYPLFRQHPLLPLKNESEFINQFNLIVDYNLKKDLYYFLNKPRYLEFPRESGLIGIIGILHGSIWFNKDGTKITAINYCSEAEERKRKALDEKVKQAMHPTVSNYSYLVFLAKTEDYLFRIDDFKNARRYSQWSIDKNMSHEPDIILYEGTYEKHESNKSRRTTFMVNDTTYILDEVWVCENKEDEGDFLIMRTKDKIFYKKKVTKIEDPFDVLPK